MAKMMALSFISAHVIHMRLLVEQVVFKLIVVNIFYTISFYYFFKKKITKSSYNNSIK